MNTNSFQIKGWSITITVALLALYVNNGNEKFILIAIAPTILFWLLDTYYLQQERKFRGIYNDIAGLSKIEEKLIIKNFEMPIHKYRKGKYNYFKVMWSKTIWTFYFIQIILLIVGSIILSR
jgi:hypothetical protein